MQIRQWNRDRDEACRRLRAFWAGKSLGDRPALWLVAKNADYKPGPCPCPKPKTTMEELNPDFQAWRHHQWLFGNHHLAEAMPGYAPAWGALVTATAELSGGTARLFGEDNDAWIEERPDLWDCPLPVFDPAHPLVKILERCYDRMAETIGERGFLYPPMPLDAMTTLSKFLGSERFCIELIENPDRVKQWSMAMENLNVAMYDHFWRYAERLGVGGASICFFAAMHEGRAQAAMCDAGVMISPEMWAEFSIPVLRRWTGSLDAALYHLDGVCQLRFLDMICSLPNLRGIQWAAEPAAGPPVKWIDTFRMLRERGLSLYISASAEDALAITRALGPDGLFFTIGCASREEGEAAIRAFEKGA